MRSCISHTHTHAHRHPPMMVHAAFKMSPGCSSSGRCRHHRCTHTQATISARDETKLRSRIEFLCGFYFAFLPCPAGFDNFQIKKKKPHNGRRTSASNRHYQQRRGAVHAYTLYRVYNMIINSAHMHTHTHERHKHIGDMFCNALCLCRFHFPFSSTVKINRNAAFFKRKKRRNGPKALLCSAIPRKKMCT